MRSKLLRKDVNKERRFKMATERVAKLKGNGGKAAQLKQEDKN